MGSGHDPRRTAPPAGVGPARRRPLASGRPSQMSSASSATQAAGRAEGQEGQRQSGWRHG
eukprot:1706511-Prymnesium_polylepis.1